MAAPTYQQLTNLSSTSGGLQAETLEERILSVLAIIASGQNPDGTTSTAVPVGSSYPPTTMFSGQRTTSFPATMAPNGTYYYRNIGGPALISKIGCVCSAQSGNIQVGIYSGTPGLTRPISLLSSSGTIACPTSTSQIALLSSVYVDQNSWFAIGADNTTASFYAGGAGGTQDAVAGAGMCYWHNGGYPFQNSPGTFPVPVMGIVHYLWGIP